MAAKHLPTFPVFKESSQYGGQKGHMLTLVRQELHTLGFTDDQIDGGGLRVTTTFTRKAMAAAAAGVKQVRPNITDKELHVGGGHRPARDRRAASASTADRTTCSSQINWAEAGGMVGSTFKPVSLAAAITDGYSLKSTWDGNSPYTFPDGLEVHNEGPAPGTSYGSAVSSVLALEQSINTAFVDMSNTMKSGPDKILSMANKMGIPPAKPDPRYPGIPSSTRDLEPDALITLGKARISAINMANTYATIANGGQRADVHVIDKVTSSDGTVKYQFKPHTTQAIDPDINADVSYAMQQVVQHGTGTNAQAVRRPAAGKTGTATNSLDQVSSSWFVGFTPQLSTAVMYVRGDGDNQLDNNWLPPYNGAAGYFGAGYPTATWAAVMKLDLVGEPVETFPPAANVAGQADRPRAGAAPTPRRPRATRRDRPRRPRPRALPPRAPRRSRARVRPPRARPTSSAPTSPTTSVPTSPPTPGGDGECAADGDARALVVNDSGRDDPEPVVHPTQDDPVVGRAEPERRRTGRRAAPGATRGGRRCASCWPWWRSCCALGLVQKAPCYHSTVDRPAGSVLRPVLLRPALPLRRPRLRRARLALLRRDRGARPLQRHGVPRRHLLLRLGNGLRHALAVGLAEHRRARWLLPGPAVAGTPEVRRETMLFVAVNAVGFALCALLAAWFLAGVHRRRPWDAAAVRRCRRSCCSTG